MNKTQQVQLPHIILLDTNIIQYTSQPRIADPLNVYLDDLLKRGFDFAISSITIYELLRRASRRTEAKMLAVLDTFRKYGLTDKVLQNAAQLESLYKLENIMSNEIEHGDKFIAATSILATSLVLTANAVDFPAPYFREVERYLITYEVKRERTRSIMVYILRPEVSVIEQRI